MGETHLTWSELVTVIKVKRTLGSNVTITQKNFNLTRLQHEPRKGTFKVCGPYVFTLLKQTT